MTDFHSNPSAPIKTAIDQALAVIDLLETIPHTRDAALAGYRQALNKIPDHLTSGRIRIAVVGVIKSGKSTFINSLAGKELVKRGAGVVTAITTRIRKGKKNRACICLKSWDEINQQIGKTLEMFPDAGLEGHFDLRRKKDRACLEQVYQRLKMEFPVTREGIRPETVLIRNALEGFDACQEITGADEARVVFEGKGFDGHKAFTADPSRAFYVKDVLLEVFGKTIAPHIEIADCQGADSTDPAQLAQILSYIESANFIVYCISSRTGLRQSDIAFLKTIKRMGLLENILFVNNCDLSEHEDLADLKQIEKRIQQELALLTPSPDLYSFSALYNLFDSLGSKLSKRNRARLTLWETDAEMAGFSLENSRSFFTTYNRLLEKNHFDLLVSNHVERIRIMAQDLDRKTRIMSQLLQDDLDGQEQAKAQLAELSENAQRLRAIVDNSVDGAVAGLSREIESNLARAFNRDTMNVQERVSTFIRTAPIDVAPYRSGIKETGFKQILYLMFQDFKRRLDRFALEEVIPDLKQLVRDQEKRIESYFQSLLDSYQVDFPVLGVGTAGADGSGTSFSRKKDLGAVRVVDIQAIKKILGLELPKTAFTAKYSPRVQVNAITGLGLHSVLLFFGALADKHIRFSFTPGFNNAAARMKKETLVSIRQQIQLYHTGLKADYFTPLIQAVTRDFRDKIVQRFTQYDTLNQDMENLLALKQEEKDAHQENIQKASHQLSKLWATLDEIV